jgi:hypothetical protein
LKILIGWVNEKKVLKLNHFSEAADFFIYPPPTIQDLQSLKTKTKDVLKKYLFLAL